MAEAYIVGAVRTAGGRRGGRLAGWHPVDLAAQVLDALVARSHVDPALVDDVFMGCVMQVGEQAVNVARNAVLASRLPLTVPGTTIDRQCGSSQQALHFAAQAVMAGVNDVVIAAGVESMTRVPMFSASILAQKAGMGFYQDCSLRSRYPEDFSQFTGAEMMAKQHGFTKDALDEFAEPLQRQRHGLDRPPAGRLLCKARHVHVAEGGQHQRARDGRRGHHQHIRRIALGGDGKALVYAEAVLLVDDRQHEVAEADALLKQSMRTDDDIDFARCQAG